MTIFFFLMDRGKIFWWVEEGFSPRKEIVLSLVTYLFLKDPDSSLRQNPLRDGKNPYHLETLIIDLRTPILTLLPDIFL